MISGPAFSAADFGRVPSDLPDPQPAVLPTLNLTESAGLAILRSFLLGIVAPGTEVVKAQVNRVPEPIGTDFIVMTPLAQERLATNGTTYYDTVFTGSIAGVTLTVASVARGKIYSGVLLIDGVWPTMRVAVGTVVVAQLTGTPHGVGTYTVSRSQTLASETIYAGTRADLVATEWTVQLDVHGPASADNIRVIDTLFRSEYGVDVMGYAVSPLFCDPAHQAPFLNAEQQVEFRWSMDAHLMIAPTVDTAQQFFTDIEVDTEVADVGLDLLVLANDDATLILATDDGGAWLRPA